jgi:hypothetical protein
MTYGWAILVVLAAIAALAYFGVLSPDRFLPNKCTVNGGFSCVEYKVNSGGPLQVNLQNNLGADATNVVVTLSSDDCVLAPVAATDTYGDPANAIPVGLENGDRTGLLSWTCGTFPTSGKFSADVDVVYWQSGQSVNHTASGTISGSVE